MVSLCYGYLAVWVSVLHDQLQLAYKLLKPLLKWYQSWVTGDTGVWVQ